jgi:hypothetical protein
MPCTEDGSKWTPDNSTMGTIENSAIYTVSKIFLGDRRSTLRELNALFNKLRRGLEPKEIEAPPPLEDFF